MLSGHRRCYASLGAQRRNLPAATWGAKRKDALLDAERETARRLTRTPLTCFRGDDIDQNIPNLRTGMLI